MTKPSGSSTLWLQLVLVMLLQVAAVRVLGLEAEVVPHVGLFLFGQD